MGGQIAKDTREAVDKLTSRSPNTRLEATEWFLITLLRRVIHSS
jgi:hypothetical protein